MAIGLPIKNMYLLLIKSLLGLSHESLKMFVDCCASRIVLSSPSKAIIMDVAALDLYVSQQH